MAYNNKTNAYYKISTSLIDNMFVSARIYDSHTSGILLDDISDHLPCLLSVTSCKLKKKECTVITSRKITPKTLSSMKEKISAIDFCDMVTNNSIDTAFDKLHENMLNIIDSVAPYESFFPGKCSYRKESWLPASLLKSIKKQKMLYKRTFSKNCKEESIAKYKTYRNILTRVK